MNKGNPPPPVRHEGIVRTVANWRTQAPSKGKSCQFLPGRNIRCGVGTSSKFSREARNPDFWVRSPDLQMLAHNSLFLKHGSPSKPHLFASSELRGQSPPSCH